ncbi:MAG: hypothetical protein ACU84Q_02180 [Gammaproteobacteria bacterium]
MINWEALQAIVESLGLIAIIASLIFVGFQIRQNSEEIRSSSYHGATELFNTWNLTLTDNPELARIWLKGQESFGELSAEEMVTFEFLLRAVFRIWDTVYYQSRHGTGDKALWECERENVEVLFKSAGTRKWWWKHPYGFSEDFSVYVENHILTKYSKT